MGSTTSKSIDPELTVGRSSYSRNVFQSSCTRPPSGSSDGSEIDEEEAIDDEQVSNLDAKENGTLKSKGKTDGNKNVRMKRRDKRASDGEWGESSMSGRNRSTRFLSRFNFFPSSRSSKGAYPESCTSSNDGDLQSYRLGKTRQGCDLFPSCFLPQDDDSDSGSDNSSIHELSINVSNENPRNVSESRRTESREPVEQNVRFSRTLSVGRLRDRVLHRPTFPELPSFQPQRGERVQTSETGSNLASENAMISISATTSGYSSSTISNSLYGNQVQNVGPREIRYNSLLEHRSNFLERRRRIRSQVHALQRMGSRFENHDRACIMSGQHLTGQCLCRLNNRDPTNNGTRGSISRIVLLAEALFEVLDEIHQQSVVSSSRPALSSIGSVPAPVEAVEALPVKRYHKLPKHLTEEDAQCYICLVEYEDGDEVRVLPCHHEFHRLCIDKWLKEIHRICPLCRGDVCKTGSLATET